MWKEKTVPDTVVIRIETWNEHSGAEFLIRNCPRVPNPDAWHLTPDTFFRNPCPETSKFAGQIDLRKTRFLRAGTRQCPPSDSSFRVISKKGQPKGLFFRGSKKIPESENQGLGIRGWGLGKKHSGFRVSDSRFKIQDSGLRIPESQFRSRKCGHSQLPAAYSFPPTPP